MAHNGEAPDIETALAIIPQPVEALAIGREPDIVLSEAVRAATALKKVIDSKPKKVTFNNKVYLEAEDWGTVARFYGVTSRIKSTKFIEFGEGDESRVKGFEAIAEAYLVSTGQIISTAESMCLDDERNWKAKPLFQLRSMAQTRASSRVLRQVFGWVVVLAGYSATPAEEMQEVIDMGVPCYECGEDVMGAEWIKNSKLTFGKTLCKICQKAAKPVPVKKDEDLTGKLEASIEQIKAKRATIQPTDVHVSFKK